MTTVLMRRSFNQRAIRWRSAVKLPNFLRLCVPVWRYRHVMLCTSYVNPRCMQIQRWKSLGCVCFRSILLSLARVLCHIGVSQK